MTGNATQEDTRRFQRHIERKKKEILELENDVLEKREKVSCLTYTNLRAYDTIAHRWLFPTW